MGRVISFVSAAVTLGAISVFAQPGPVPTTPDLPCTAKPGTEHVAIPDSAGYVQLFNGTDMTGWWQDCQTEDSQKNRKTGAVIKADPATHSIYVNQRAAGEGGMVATNSRWGNHEIILEYWPTWGNDGGLFHMTRDDGSAFQTVIDYYGGGECIGGVYPQHQESSSFGSFYKCSYFFNSATTLKKGNATFTGIDWTKFVYANMFDPNGWMELHVKIFSKHGQPPHHQSWVRNLKYPTATLVTDVTWPAGAGAVADTGYIGLQIHGAFGGENPWSGKGDWFRNIRIRKLDEAGNPIIPTKVETFNPKLATSFSASSTELKGWLDRDYDITVRDLSGRALETFHGASGSFTHAFSGNIRHGMLFVELQSGAAKKTIRVAPI